MTSLTHESVERSIRTAYEARIRGDVDGIMRHFSDGVHFAIAGSTEASPVPLRATGAAAVREAMQGLVDAFEFDGAEIVSLVVDGPKAAVHWRVRIRKPGTSEWTDTELVDLLRFDGDLIVSFQQFADTALAARLAAP